MKRSLCGLALFAQVAVAWAGLQEYSSFVVADKNPNSPAPRDTIRVSYLGVNGFQFENGNHVLLVDPYFTRIDFWSAALNQRIESNPNRVAAGMQHLRPRADGILVTHAHFDHLLDAPEVMRRTGGKLFAGPTAISLVESLGISPNECRTVKPGTIQRVGPWTIRVVAAQHDRLFGKVPFAASTPASKPPAKASDWVVGEPLAFIIEVAGKRIYIDSGGTPGSLPRNVRAHVDLAILGVALPDSRARFAEVVRQLQPRYILPSHQDDFFAPFNRGFSFGRLTDFPKLIEVDRKEHLPGRLILLDYFRPWTLP